MRSKKEIVEVLKDSRIGQEEAGLAESYRDADIYQGWIEALEYVLHDSKKLKGKLTNENKSGNHVLLSKSTRKK